MKENGDTQVKCKYLKMKSLRLIKQFSPPILQSCNGSLQDSKKCLPQFHIFSLDRARVCVFVVVSVGIFPVFCSVRGMCVTGGMAARAAAEETPVINFLTIKCSIKNWLKLHYSDR